MNNKIKSILAVLVIISMIIPAMAVGNANSNKAQNVIGGVEVAPGVFYLGQAIDKGQVVEGYAFVHYTEDFAKARKTKPVVDDNYDKYKFLLPSLRLRWAEPMTYEVDNAGETFDGVEDITTILGASVNTWNEVTLDTIFNTPEDQTANVEPGAADGYNIVVWRNLGSGGTIAYNSLWINRYLETIIDSDVVFNSYYEWADCEKTDCATKMDLQNIATHEFGHNGLGDLYMPPSKALTMHGYDWFGDIGKRTLGDGDKLGIQALYGVRE